MANTAKIVVEDQDRGAENETSTQGFELIHEGEHFGVDLDIIVVHGLGVDPKTSWDWSKSDNFNQTRSHSFNWIVDKDGLQSHFPKTRIMLFKYMSAWHGKYKVRTSLQAIAKDLLAQLAVKRNGVPRRPIIFISHCFGGLVVAKALCIADEQPGQHSDIVPCVAGCLFFGTPFKGVELARLAVYWETFRTGNGMKEEDYTDLLHLVEWQSSSVMDLRSSMRSLAQRMHPEIPTTSIFELKPIDWGQMIKKVTKMKGVSAIITSAVVDKIKKSSTCFVIKESASLFEEKSLARDCSHSDLVRFPSKDDNAYTSIVAELEHMVFNAGMLVRDRYNQRKMVKDEERSELVKILETGQNMRVKRDVLAASLAAHSFLVNDPEFDFWCTRAPRSKRCIWVDGPPGMGKTAASLNAITRVENQIAYESQNMPSMESTLSAWFFCESQTNCCTAEDLLKSIILQLIDQKSRLAIHALAFVKTLKAPSDASSQATSSKRKKPLTVEHLWQCLLLILNDNSLKCVYIIVNNLHQLDQNSPSTEKFLQSISSDVTSSKEGRARWLFTSSNQYRKDIALCLVDASEVQFFDLKDPKYANHVDLARKKDADKRSASLAKDLGLEVSLEFEIRNTMVEKAEDALWMDILCLQLTAMPHRERLPILEHLDHVPLSNTQGMIEDAWQLIFDHLDPKTIGSTKDILRALVLVKNDVNVRDLSVLTHYKLDDLINLLKPCAPLIELRGRDERAEVNFFDTKLKEGLRKAWGKLLSISKRSLSQSDVEKLIERQHCLMALNCLSFFRNTAEKLQGATIQKNQASAKVEAVETLGTDKSVPVNEIKSIVEREETYDKRDDFFEPSNGEGVGTTFDGANEELSDDDTDEDSDGYSEVSFDDWESEVGKEKRSPPALMPWEYPVKLWSYHAAQGGRAAASSLCNDIADFWIPKSIARHQWLLAAIEFGEDYDETTDTNLPALHVAASQGLTDLIETLLSSGQGHDVDEVDGEGLTAICWAAGANHSETLQLLLNRNATIDNPKASLSPLHAAAEWGRVGMMKTLMNPPNNANPNAISSTSRSVIHAAIRSGVEGAVELILNHPNIDLEACNHLPNKGDCKDEHNSKDIEGQSKQQKEDGKEINNSSDVCTVGDEKQYEAQNGQSGENEIQDKIKDDGDDGGEIDDDSDDDDDDDEDEDILSLAASTSEVCLKMLLNHAKANWCDNDVNNAIWKACEDGRKESLEILLELDRAFSKEWLEVCMITAASQDFWEIVQTVLKYRPSGDLRCEDIFFLAATALPAQTEILLSIWCYAKSNISQGVKDAALYQAADYEKLDTVKWLIDTCKSDVNADYEKLDHIDEDCYAKDVPNYGDALTAAAYDGNVDMINLLLAHGANIDSPKGAALQMAAFKGHKPVVELLLKQGANKNRILPDELMEHLDHGKSLTTALQAACDTQQPDIVQLLLDAGADPNLGGGDMTCPIFSATRLGQEDILILLLSAAIKVDVNVSGGPDGSFPLSNACLLMSLDCIKQLLNHGANVNAIDRDGDQAIHTAIHEDNTELLKLLLDHGADVTGSSGQKSFPLHYAVLSDRLDCAMILCEAMLVILDEIREAKQQKEIAITTQSADIHKQETNMVDDEKSSVLQQQIEDLQQLNAKLSSSLKGFEHETRGNDVMQQASHVELQERLCTLEEEYQQTKYNYTILQEDNDSLTYRLHCADKKYTTLQEKYIQLQQDVKILEEEKSAIQREQEQSSPQESSSNIRLLEQHKDALDAIQHQLDEERESFSLLSKQHRDLNSEYQRMRAGWEAAYMQQQVEIERLNGVLEAQKRYNTSSHSRDGSENASHLPKNGNLKRGGYEGYATASSNGSSGNPDYETANFMGDYWK